MAKSKGCLGAMFEDEGHPGPGPSMCPAGPGLAVQFGWDTDLIHVLWLWLPPCFIRLVQREHGAGRVSDTLLVALGKHVAGLSRLT